MFYSGQYDFRVNHSTQLAALELIDRITQYLDQGNIPLTMLYGPIESILYLDIQAQIIWKLLGN